MKQKILNTINKIEKKQKIKLLFLIESGSRAWKWESEDSDYDIRGVYVQDYLKVDDLKEQITIIDKELDIVLWDLRKFLRLMKKSNPSVWEWLSSDIVYIDSTLRKKLTSIFKKDFSQQALEHHYASMARQNFEKYINTEKSKTNLKKYVYVLRSIACILWIQKYQTPPPKDYNKVAKYLPKKVKIFFDKIVKDKRKSEKLEGDRNLEIEKYITSFFNKDIKKTQSNFDDKKIDLIFKQAIMNSK